LLEVQGFTLRSLAKLLGFKLYVQELHLSTQDTEIYPWH